MVLCGLFEVFVFVEEWLLCYWCDLLVVVV